MLKSLFYENSNPFYENILKPKITSQNSYLWFLKDIKDPFFIIEVHNSLVHQ